MFLPFCWKVFFCVSDFILNCLEVKQNLREYLFKRFSCSEEGLIKDCEALKGFSIHHTDALSSECYDASCFTTCLVLSCTKSGFPRISAAFFSFFIFLFMITDNSSRIFHRKKGPGICCGPLFFSFFLRTQWKSVRSTFAYVLPNTLPSAFLIGLVCVVHCAGNMCDCVREVLSSPQLIRASPLGR